MILRILASFALYEIDTLPGVLALFDNPNQFEMAALTCRLEEGGRDDDVCEPVECGGERHGAALARRREDLAEDDPRDGAEAEGVGAHEPDEGRQRHETYRTG